MEALEKVQKRAMKSLPALRHLSCSERLKTCNLPTLHFRRIRGDLIETYKILTGKYDVTAVPTLVQACTYVTRGNDLRLQKTRFRYDIRKYCLTNRVVNIWNSVPNWVISANMTNTFKNRLDKFWQKQEIINDFCAQLE